MMLVRSRFQIFIENNFKCLKLPDNQRGSVLEVAGGRVCPSNLFRGLVQGSGGKRIKVHQKWSIDSGRHASPKATQGHAR